MEWLENARLPHRGDTVRKKAVLYAGRGQMSSREENVNNLTGIFAAERIFVYEI